MSKSKKLGRNPLSRTKTVQRIPAPTLPVILSTTGLDKIKEMQIQINWPELYETTVGLRIKRISKLFSTS
jgi:hypothetical protein